MAFGAVLVVFAIAQQAGDPAWSSLQGAAREVLGESAEIRVVAVPADPPDSETLERAGQADAVVELSWSEDHQRAELHCYVAREAHWVDRTITFAENDQPEERGRLLGFALASMIRKGDAEPAPAPTPEPQPVPVPAPELDSTPRPSQASVPDSHRKRTRSLEVAATGTKGIDGEADGIGASAGVRLPLVGPIAFRLSVGGRAGEIDPAHASSRTFLAGVGLAWSALDPVERLELGMRVDALASYFEINRLSTLDDEVESQSRWTAGGALVVEGGYRFVDFAGICAALGLEAVAGETSVYAQGNQVATVPVLRVVAELGFRSRF